MTSKARLLVELISFEACLADSYDSPPKSLILDMVASAAILTDADAFIAYVLVFRAAGIR